MAPLSDYALRTGRRKAPPYLKDYEGRIVPQQLPSRRLLSAGPLEYLFISYLHEYLYCGATTRRHPSHRVSTSVITDHTNRAYNNIERGELCGASAARSCMAAMHARARVCSLLRAVASCLLSHSPRHLRVPRAPQSSRLSPLHRKLIRRRGCRVVHRASAGESAEKGAAQADGRAGGRAHRETGACFNTY